MKRIIFLMLAATWLFAACEGPAGRNGLDGLDGAETYWFVKTYTINANQWQLVNGVDQLNSYYYATVAIPELNKDIYEKGHVFCYMFQRVNGREVQTLLPYTIPLGTVKDNTELLWTETYSCDFSPGQITFYFNCSDFYTSNRPPAASFRVVLNY